MVMDLFFENAPTVKKKRIHFSAFMLSIHEKMLTKQKEREKQLSRGFLKRILPKIHDDVGGTADSSEVKLFNFFGLGPTIVLNSGSGDYNEVDTDHEDPLPIIAREMVSVRSKNQLSFPKSYFNPKSY